MGKRDTKPQKSKKTKKKSSGEKCGLKWIKPQTQNQNQYIKDIKQSVLTFGVGPAGTGKAQPLTSNILTPTGWKLMKDIQKGDSIITPDNNTVKVLDVFPQGNKDIYKVTFSDGSSARCCLDHLWYTETCLDRDAKRKGGVKSLKEISENLKHNNKRNHSIPLVKPLELLEICRLNPYLMGLLLGDGCTKHHLSISTSDAEIVYSLNHILKEYNCQLKHTTKYDYNIKSKDSHKGPVPHRIKKIDNDGNEVVYENIKEAINAGFIRHSIYNAIKQNKQYSGFIWKKIPALIHSTNPIKSILIDLNLWDVGSGDKFIPNEFKLSSIASRISLLQGLLDTDGYIDTRGLISFVSKSHKLASDTRDIIHSLGGSCRISEIFKEYKGEKRKYFSLAISLPKNIVPFRLSRKIKRLDNKKYKYNNCRYFDKIEFDGIEEAKCILIDSDEHLYITDDYIVTHNTLLAVNYGVNEILKKNYKKLIITRPVVEAGEKLGFLPGDLEEKLDPYLKPIFDYINEILGNTEDARGWISKHVEIAPLAFMRGRTFNNSFIILDEAQNTTKEQMKMFLTRIGYDSKAIVTADPTQIDLKDICTSGILEILEVLNNKPDVKICKFYECDIVRSKIVQTIVEAYGDYYDDKEKPKDKL